VTVLTLIQNAAVELGLQAPTAVVNNTTDTQTQQLLRLSKRVIKDISNEYQWPQLRQECLITIAANTASYNLPADFDYAIARTGWDRNNHWELMGPISPQEWQLYKSGIIATLPRKRFRVMGANGSNQFNVFPTPGTADAGTFLAFEYQSANFVQPVQWTTGTAFAAGAYCSNGGNLYSTVAGGTSGATPPTWTSGSNTDGGITWVYTLGPYSDFKADTDTSVINEDVVTLGTAAKFAQMKLLGFADALKEDFERALRQEMSSIKGAPDISLNRRRGSIFLSPINVPDTGYGP